MSPPNKLAAFAISACIGACAAPEPEPDPEAGLCPVRLSPDAASQAVMWINVTDVELGQFISCSGAVIAPNLVLTAGHCVLRSLPGPFACDQNDDWRLIEDGSGRGRLGDAYALERISINQTDADGFIEPVAAATQVIAFGASTRCADNLAAVVFDPPLDLDPLPLRLTQSTREGEELTLSGFDFIERRRHQTALRVAHVAGGLSTEQAPARGLRLAGGACDLDTGGPIFSNTTGALVALPFAPSTGDCAAPEAETLALEIARYSAFVEALGEAAGAELRREADAYAPLGDGHCPPPHMASP